MRRLIGLSLVLVLALANLGAGRMVEPVTINAEADKVAAILDRSGWVSPGGSGPALYLVSFRDCPGCRIFEKQQMPRLMAAGVDMRVIMFAWPDVRTIKRSTAAERATVAELWLNRDWPLLQRWLDGSSASWKAKGLPVADGDPEREKALTLSYDVAHTLMRITGDQGLEPAVPLLIWQDQGGRWRACHCVTGKAMAAMRGELGLK